MITVQEAIDLATKAHEGQWRNNVEISYSKAESLMSTKDFYNLTLGGVTNTKAGKVAYFPTSGLFKLHEPYITHPLAVMNMMDTDEEKIVAVLHDVIENTSARVNSSRNYATYKGSKYKIGEHIRCALNSITHYKDESYNDYIQAVSENKLATKIKLADIFHNMSCNPSEHAKQKYLKAIPMLLKSL